MKIMNEIWIDLLTFYLLYLQTTKKLLAEKSYIPDKMTTKRVTMKCLQQELNEIKKDLTNTKEELNEVKTELKAAKVELKDLKTQENLNKEKVILDIDEYQSNKIILIICTVCGKTFPTKHKLELHIEEHGLEKMFQCDICAKKFYLEWRLDKHQRVHMENVKPCRYFTNKVECPFEPIGCKFKHEESPNPTLTKEDNIPASNEVGNDKTKAVKNAEDTVDDNSLLLNQARLEAWYTYSCTNVESEIFYCDQCNCDFEEEPSLEGHKEIFHEDGNTCDYCENESKPQSN